MGGIDQKQLDALQKKAEAASDEIDRLCAAGKKTEAGDACKCPADCHTCQGLTCSLCKNKAVLLDGSCGSSDECSSAGGRVTGAGNFGRACAVSDETTTEAAATTTAPCPSNELDHFAASKQGVRLKGSQQLVLDGGASAVANSATCARLCVGAGKKCKAFELKARGGILRCNLMSASSKTSSIVLSNRWDLYDRLDFCGSD